jgi:uncharacterized repeat protein (TIGR01451 family)
LFSQIVEDFMKRLIFQIFLTLWFIIIVAALPGVSLAATGGAAEIASCNLAEFTELEAGFQQMVRLQAEHPGLFSETEYKAAALNYILNADRCYHAAVSAASEVDLQSLTDPIVIDHEGEWAPGYGAPPGSEAFVTHGSKWGAGSPFNGGSNQNGPGITGGTVTYSFMRDGVSHATETAGVNTDVRTGLGVNQCVEAEIAQAFAAWSAVADIQFVQVVDNNAASDGAGATGDIRIGAHLIDGANGVLAHAFFPPPNGVSIAGDVHFDAGDHWSCSPGAGMFDIGFVALHELGHAIGLRHEPSIGDGGHLAVMNPFYNPSLITLQSDDLNGAASIYGPGQPLTLSKQLVTPPSGIIPGATLTYKITVQNLSPQSVADVTLSDALPASSSYILGTAVANPAIVNLSSFPNSIAPFMMDGNSTLEIVYNVQLDLVNKGHLLVSSATVDAPSLPQPVQVQHTAIVDPFIVALPIILKAIN